MVFSHKTVLLNKTIEYIEIKSNGVYVDATAGGGGLSGVIASKLSGGGKLICIDQDPDAVAVCEKRFKVFNNVFVVRENFSNMDKVLKDLNISCVDGIVMDLGVSSYQLDEGERGFSYNKDARLDMRMSKSGISAYEVVNEFSYGELKNIIKNYGEERFAGNIANSIVQIRDRFSVETTKQLADIVVNSIPCAARRKGGHPAKRTFQAIRIFVNDELNNLKKGLEKAFDAMSSGGRLAVITFHSLEDRIVKNKMNELSRGCVCPKDFPVCVCGNIPKAKIICKKAITPTREELDSNLRSRSAKLRIIEKM